jgi:hypothetical protein
MFTNFGMPDDATHILYKGYREYNLAKFGKIVYESSTSTTSTSLWTECSPYSPKTGRTTASIDAACRKLDWMMNNLASDA